jgi:hypothetical protein
MSEASVSNQRICPHCEAVSRPGARYCWLCGAEVKESWSRAGAVNEGDRLAKREDAAVPAGSQFVSMLLLFLTLAAIVCGVFAMAPGLGVVVGIAVLAGFLGVLTRTASAAARGAPISGGQKVGTFVRTAAVTAMTILTIALIALASAVLAFVALFAQCLAALSHPPH